MDGNKAALVNSIKRNQIVCILKDRKGEAYYVYLSFISWARSVMKEYRSSLPGFKDYPKEFSIKKIRVNEDDYYFYD